MLRTLSMTLLAAQLVSTTGYAADGTKTTTVAHAQIETDVAADGALLSASLGFAVLMELIIGTGELRPQAPVDSSVLLPLDRWRAESDFVADYQLSNIGLGVMGALALTDVILMGATDRGDEWTDYLVVYAETAAITLAVTDLAKIAVRRPRPIAYRDAREGINPSSTGTALSFFSGHSSMAGALAGTAAYLAWTRGDKGEAWAVTLGGGTLAAFVAAMRVVEGKHFPTDVIAGLLVGAGIGVMVPVLHRTTGVRLTGAIVEGGAMTGVAWSF